MTFWITVGIVFVVLLALAWWSSGRTKPGVDVGEVHRRIGKAQGEATRKAGHVPPGGPTGGVDGFSGGGMF